MQMRTSSDAQRSTLLQSLPPGPRATLFNMARAAFYPHAFHVECVRRYGPTFTLPTGLGPMVLTTAAEDIQRIFAGDSDAFDAPTPGILQAFLGEGSLLNLIGARHRRERKLMMPPFHGERITAYGRLIQEVALRHAAGWPRGKPFSMRQTTQAITLEVIIRAIFGVKDPERVPPYRRAVIEYIDAFSPLILFFPHLRREFGGFGPWHRFSRAIGHLHGLLGEDIRRQRGDTEQTSILSLLLAIRDEEGRPMSDEEVRDEMVTLLFAGQETTALALAWAFHRIHRAPEVLERLRAELAPLGETPSPEELARLPYLEAVCHETLRLEPIILVAGRVLKYPMRLGGYEIPANTMVTTSISAVHANPALYPEPERFNPERFLTRKFAPHEFLPFGGGIRRCLGAAFALYEMKIVLGSLLARHSLALVDDRPVRSVRRNLVTGPRGGVEMIERAR